MVEKALNASHETWNPASHCVSLGLCSTYSKSWGGDLSSVTHLVLFTTHVEVGPENIHF
jgi:hypothetical protein